MVNIVVAGGTGELGREVVDALVAAKKHNITVFTRDASKYISEPQSGLSYVSVDYDDSKGLVQALSGTHTVLSFVNQPAIGTDTSKSAQIKLIDACIKAGVKRFAPSEFGSVGKDDLPFWAGKTVIKQYLDKVNENGKVLEYTLFQPGLFLNYLASPHKTTKYVTPLDSFFDFNNRRAIVVEGHEDAMMSLTAVDDIAGVVVQAVDYEGEWPEYGGIQGNRVSVSRVIEIGEKIRGPFTIATVKMEDLEAGKLDVSWSLGASHPSFDDKQAEAMQQVLKTVLVGTLLSSAKGAWDVSDAWNKRLPGYTFVPIEDFLTRVWTGKA